MSLSSALQSAQTIFNNTGLQTSVASKNISNVGNANYVRRSAVLSTVESGAEVITTWRNQNESLLRQTIESSSLYSGQTTLRTGLEEMKNILGGNDYENSPSTKLSKFSTALANYAKKPGDAALGATAVSNAQDLVNSLNGAANEIQQMRVRADKDIALQVEKLNGLLAEFEITNNKVKVESAANGDPNDALDRRDALVKQISEIVGISASMRGDNGDMVLYTTSGATLFETTPRKVTFTPSIAHDATTTGNPVRIDGVTVPAGIGSDTTAEGSLQGLLQLRDSVIPVFQNQLDQIAGALIINFAEKDQAATPTKPALPGLFTSDTGTVPAVGTVVPGLAAKIRVNPSVVPPTGSPNKIRDGGASGADADYVVNKAAANGYSALIDKYATSLGVKTAFNPTGDIDEDASILAFSTNSVGWLEKLRSNATAADESKAANYTRLQDAYSNKTGASLDEEMALLLELEQSFKAATKLVSTIDEMMKSLIEMAGR